VVLNKAPGLDTIDEIILNGSIIGSLYFDISEGDFKVIMRLSGAKRIEKGLKRGFIVVDEGAVEPIRKGASALVPGILEASEGISKGNEIIILEPSRNVIATGMARLSSAEIKTSQKGSAVKNRWYGDFREVPDNTVKKTWDDVISANEAELGRCVSKAVKFIRRIENEVDKVPVVSFSGGKDSLATLLLVLEAELKPELLFIDTGLELPETLEYVHQVASRYDLELTVESAGDAFWSNLDYFGPPGKDFRWCCKTCKLGPASKLIARKFPGGVLSFIGQRSYESEPRSKKGPYWRNPWVPGQFAASPIQKWTALHIWLFLFSKKAPINPWYHRGLDRIGCWLCPASNLAEFKMVEKYHGEYQKWKNFLKSYSNKNELSEAWYRFGLWRWRRPPKEILELARAGSDNLRLRPIKSDYKENGELKVIDEEQSSEGAPEIHTVGKYRFISAGGYEDCKGEISLEGIFDFDFDFNRVSNLLNIMSEVKIDDETKSAVIGRGTVIFDNGSMSVQAETKEKVNRVLRDIHNLIVRSRDCVKCGICESRCPSGALSCEPELDLDPAICDHCRKCMGPCAVIDFESDREFEF
jgi:phosphoadenosine phosphosulfate reductase